MKRLLILLVLAAVGCSRTTAPTPAPLVAPSPAGAPVATEAPAPAPDPAPDPMPAEQPQALPPALFHANNVIGLPDYVAVAMPGASVTFRFTLPMDRAAVQSAVALQVQEPRMTWLNDLELRVDIPLTAGQTVTLDSAGMPDRWGRKVAGSSPLVLKAFPLVSMRRFTYDPASDEAHPFTGEQIPGVFTEGAPNPNDGWPMLLWAEEKPLLVGGPSPVPRLLPAGSVPPLFYGWMPDGERVVYTIDGDAVLVDLSGTVLRSYKGPLLGGAISARSGLVALFRPTAGGDTQLIIWNPDTGEVRGCGAVVRHVTQQVSASWSPDESQLVFAMNGQLSLFDINACKLTVMAGGFSRPLFSPVRNDQIYAEKGTDAVILSPDGAVLHTLPGQGWFWHPSGLALDRSAPPQNGQPPFDEWITNYRLADRRLLQRGKGLVIGEGPGPGAGAMYHLFTPTLPN